MFDVPTLTTMFLGFDVETVRCRTRRRVPGFVSKHRRMFHGFRVPNDGSPRPDFLTGLPTVSRVRQRQFALSLSPWRFGLP